MKPRLTVIVGEPKGGTFTLPDEPVSIGRDFSNEIQVQGKLVSRTHALIEPHSDGWKITDLGSRNGTYVNGEHIKTCELKPGDEIRVGDVTLVLTQEETEIPENRAGGTAGQQQILTETYVREDSGVLPSRIEEKNLDELIDVNRKLRALLDLTRSVGAARSVHDLMRGAAEAAKASLDPDRVFTLTMNEDGTLVPWNAADSDFDRDLGKLPISYSIVEHTRKKCVAVLSRNASADRRFKSAASIRINEIATAMCVPIVRRDKLLGMLYIDRMGDAESFTRDDLEMLSAIAICLAAPLENIAFYQELRQEKQELQKEIRHRYNLIGESKPMKAVYNFIEKASASDACVLIMGESGTGKELVARAIHYSSNRAGKAFEIVNCAALSHTLMDSELFGHCKGAFTDARQDKPGRFELAHKGTIFLDEIGELSDESQSKLLRVLEQGELRRLGDTKDRHVDIRVIAATNRDLRKDVEAGRFRADLYYRLNVLSIYLPPLRERPGDLDLLVNHFLKEFSNKCGRKELRLGEKARQALRRYSWPGNVRQLKNVIERMIVMTSSDELGFDDLPGEVRGAAEPTQAGAPGPRAPLAEVEKHHILRVLQETRGNKKEAARILGIDRSTLYSRLKMYGIDA